MGSSCAKLSRKYTSLPAHSAHNNAWAVNGGTQTALEISGVRQFKYWSTQLPFFLWNVPTSCLRPHYWVHHFVKHTVYMTLTEETRWNEFFLDVKSRNKRWKILLPKIVLPWTLHVVRLYHVSVLKVVQLVSFPSLSGLENVLECAISLQHMLSCLIKSSQLA